MNPLLERVQQFMDWSFEGGLQQAWEVFMNKAVKLLPKNDRQFLELKDFSQVFALLGIGLFISALICLMEFLYHKYSEDLYMRWVFFKDEMYIRRIQRRNLQLRRVQVHPVHFV